MHRMRTTVFMAFVVIAASCADSSKNFSDTFKADWMKSCQNQAGVNLDKNKAKRYCQCSLEIVMDRYKNEDEARAAIPTMSVNQVQQILVLPCMK